MASAHGHTFHIPVMGIGFTLDTPLKVAHYGIGSCMSLVDDFLVEQTHEHYCRELGRTFVRLPSDHPDPRAERIRRYLDFVDERSQVALEDLRRSSFDEPLGIRRYLRLLPAASPLKALYEEWKEAAEPRRTGLEAQIRARVALGDIEVNIMTKLDRADDKKGLPRPEGQSDALAAARGFAESTLSGALVLSAGLNQKLFAYLDELRAFLPDANGRFQKRLVLKVSDLRSALIQGKLLAKKGLWVHEYRIESGLNCGGHAFPTEGHLLGPILEEFKAERPELDRGWFDVYAKALEQRGVGAPSGPPEVRVTVQGGIGTSSEDRFLLERYAVDGTGWGSPFLMVPEVVAIDDETLAKLVVAKPGDVRLTWGSPLGVRFWNLVTAESNVDREQRFSAGRPGSECPKGFLALNHEFGLPLCPASRGYQKKKLSELKAKLGADDYVRAEDRIAEACCICHDLGGSLKRKYSIESAARPCICPGPNVINFQRRLTLEEMVDHIYGRTNVLTRPERPHQFIKELDLYLDYVAEELLELGTPRATRSPSSLKKFLVNLEGGIAYYEHLADEVAEARFPGFRAALAERAARFRGLLARYETTVPAAKQETETAPRASTAA